MSTTVNPPDIIGDGGSHTGRKVALIIVFLILLAVFIAVVLLIYCFRRKMRILRDKENMKAMSRRQASSATTSFENHAYENGGERQDNSFTVVNEQSARSLSRPSLSSEGVGAYPDDRQLIGNRSTYQSARQQNGRAVREITRRDEDDVDGSHARLSSPAVPSISAALGIPEKSQSRRPESDQTPTMYVDEYGCVTRSPRESWEQFDEDNISKHGLAGSLILESVDATSKSVDKSTDSEIKKSGEEKKSDEGKQRHRRKHHHRNEDANGERRHHRRHRRHRPKEGEEGYEEYMRKRRHRPKEGEEGYEEYMRRRRHRHRRHRKEKNDEEETADQKQADVTNDGSETSDWDTDNSTEAEPKMDAISSLGGNDKLVKHGALPPLSTGATDKGTNQPNNRKLRGRESLRSRTSSWSEDRAEVSRNERNKRPRSAERPGSSATRSHSHSSTRRSRERLSSQHAYRFEEKQMNEEFDV